MLSVMNVLAVNCGTTSLKWALLDDGDHQLAGGLLEVAGAVDYAGAAATVVLTLDRLGLRDRVEAVGHRVVHGGSRFTGPTRIDDTVVGAIGEAAALAPLHNRPALEAIGALSQALPAVPAVATFDTAFHHGMPEAAARYPLDPALTAPHGLRRYGFHGLAHRSMNERHAALTDRPARRVITFQLGGGCSAAAVDGGRSVETSMGLTPLEGLMMGTRTGDVDPTLAGALARAEGVPVETAEGWLSHRGGLLGVSGRSADLRELLAAGADQRSRLAVDMFCHRARKYLGAYLAVLGGADAVVFGGGIGEHLPEARRRVCERMDWCGLDIDLARNERATGGDARIAADRSAMDVWVIAVDEQRIIAADTRAVLSAAG